MMNFTMFKSQLRREYLLQIRQPWRLLYSALFFFMAVVFFPFTLPFKPELMRTLGPGFIWIALLFASLLSSIGLFEQDEESGVLEQWIVSGESLLTTVGAKITMQWVCYMVGLLVLAPLLSLLFYLNAKETVLLMLSFLLGTPTLFLLCMLAAAFNLNNGILMAMILLPLALPVLIFGSSVLTPLFSTQVPAASLAFLTAISLLTSVFLPPAIAAILRISLTE